MVACDNYMRSLLPVMWIMVFFFHVLAFNKCNYGDVDHGIFSMSYFLINVIISLQLHGCDE